MTRVSHMLGGALRYMGYRSFDLERMYLREGHYSYSHISIHLAKPSNFDCTRINQFVYAHRKFRMSLSGCASNISHACFWTLNSFWTCGILALLDSVHCCSLTSLTAVTVSFVLPPSLPSVLVFVGTNDDLDISVS